MSNKCQYCEGLFDRKYLAQHENECEYNPNSREFHGLTAGDLANVLLRHPEYNVEFHLLTFDDNTKDCDTGPFGQRHTYVIVGVVPHNQIKHFTLHTKEVSCKTEY